MTLGSTAAAPVQGSMAFQAVAASILRATVVAVHDCSLSLGARTVVGGRSTARKMLTDTTWKVVLPKTSLRRSLGTILHVPDNV